MLSKEEVKHVAKLARIELTSEEIEKFQKDLSAVLDYAEMLKEINTEKVKPCFHPSETKENVIREDEVKPSDLELTKAFPSKKEKYLKVKSVFKQ